MNELLKEQAERLLKDVDAILNKYKRSSLVEVGIIVDDLLDLRNGVEVMVLASQQAD